MIFLECLGYTSWRLDNMCLKLLRIFFAEIMNEFFILPKVFRIDNVLEFLQINLQEFYSSKGIVHQTSCAHTSQQNDVAECKHRHILDVTRTIMVEK